MLLEREFEWPARIVHSTDLLRSAAVWEHIIYESNSVFPSIELLFKSFFNSSMIIKIIYAKQHKLPILECCSNVFDMKLVYEKPSLAFATNNDNTNKL
jgi:hypothetical protein